MRTAEGRGRLLLPTVANSLSKGGTQPSFRPTYKEQNGTRLKRRNATRSKRGTTCSTKLSTAKKNQHIENVSACGIEDLHCLPAQPSLPLLQPILDGRKHERCNSGQQQLTAMSNQGTQPHTADTNLTALQCQKTRLPQVQLETQKCSRVQS